MFREVCHGAMGSLLHHWGKQENMSSGDPLILPGSVIIVIHESQSNSTGLIMDERSRMKV